jgi:hypothetical protein
MNTKYPLLPKKNYYTFEKNIYYFFNNQTYQVWKTKNGRRIIIKDINNINDARIIKGCIIRYLNSL